MIKLKLIKRKTNEFLFLIDSVDVSMIVVGQYLKRMFYLMC